MLSGWKVAKMILAKVFSGKPHNHLGGGLLFISPILQIRRLRYQEVKCLWGRV